MNTQLEIVRQYFEIERKKKEEFYQTYHRIKQDVLYEVEIAVQSASLELNDLHSGASEKLFIFNGLITKRERGKHEPRLDYWKFNLIAFQPSCINAFLDYCERKKWDFWKVSLVRIKFKWYKRRGFSYCNVDSITPISKFSKPFDDGFSNSFGNSCDTYLAKPSNSNGISIGKEEIKESKSKVPEMNEFGSGLSSVKGTSRDNLKELEQVTIKEGESHNAMENGDHVEEVDMSNLE